MPSLQIAILGCGPSALFAAHAAITEGHNVHLYSKPRKSYMNGAQYLHRPIPGLTTDSFKIDYRLIGTSDGYRNKVYGEDSDVFVSPDSLVGISEAWDIREAYDNAWEMYGGMVIQWEAVKGSDSIAGFAENYDMVINTIPRKTLCHNGCEFKSEKIISTETVSHESFIGKDNIVLCSGIEEDLWYRQSRIHGFENTEYPVDVSYPANGKIWVVEKPIFTTCSCQSMYDNVHHIGRYGRWEKGVLADSAYYETKELVK